MEAEKNEDKSFLGYFKSMKETWEVLKWSHREFVNEIAVGYIKRMYFWSFLSRIVSLTNPWLVGLGMTGLFAHDEQIAWFAVVSLFLTYVVGTVFEWRTGHFIELTLGENIRTIEHKINKIFFSKNLGLHMREGGKLTQENMEKGWNRLDMVQKSILFGGVDSGVSLFLSLSMLFVLSPISGTIIFVSLILNFLFSIYLNQFISSRMEPVEKRFRRIFRKRGERWQGVERVITSGRHEEEVEEMDKEFSDALNEDRKIWLRYILGTMPRGILAGVSVSLVGLYAGWRVWNGQMAIADIVPILTWSGMATQQMRFLARMEREVSWCTPSLKSLREALNLECDVKEKPDAIELEQGPVSIEFKNVSHSYEHARKDSSKGPVHVLSDLSFEVKPGEMVAIIGPSGAGKSTITRFLQRYTDPDQGSIFVNGYDLKDIALHSWRNLIGYISQQPRVFDGTLRENLIYGLPFCERQSITDEEIWKIMKLLRIDFGNRLTDGLNTRVGRNGMKLSGGEAQRVMIGAAALKRPRFMIIDEATSSLDAENQSAVQEGIDLLLQERSASAIIIAHRLSTVMRCDKFVVLKPVESLAPGESQIECIAHSTEELFKNSPTFRKLAELEGVRMAA